jgi:tRNA C32,U32 (ribose-2'-O)-methylase TrmJ
MSSTDPTTIGVHRALHEALNAAREARHRLDDGDAAPDLDDLVELGKLVAALSESVTAVNSEMMEKARLAQGSKT